VARAGGIFRAVRGEALGGPGGARIDGGSLRDGGVIGQNGFF
jgi:hypothetical protein